MSELIYSQVSPELQNYQFEHILEGQTAQGLVESYLHLPVDAAEYVSVIDEFRGELSNEEHTLFRSNLDKIDGKPIADILQSMPPRFLTYALGAPNPNPDEKAQFIADIGPDVDMAQHMGNAADLSLRWWAAHNRGFAENPNPSIAELAPKDRDILIAANLVHDIGEVVIGDIPRSMKRPIHETIEGRILNKLLRKALVEYEEDVPLIGATVMAEDFAQLPADNNWQKLHRHHAESEAFGYQLTGINAHDRSLLYQELGDPALSAHYAWFAQAVLSTPRTWGFPAIYGRRADFPAVDVLTASRLADFKQLAGIA